MSTKGTKNFFGGFKNPFRKNDPAQEKHQEQVMVSECRKREREMIAQLNAIKFDSPQNQLSAEKIKALNMPGVVRYVAGELKYPLIVEQDLAKLDKSLDYCVKALHTSVKEGLEYTAEWSSTALIAFIKNLRTEVDGIDLEYADALMQNKLEYALNLELLVKTSIEYDRLGHELEGQVARRQERREKLDALKASYQARRNAGLLDGLLADLKQHANDPNNLSDEAKNLRDELNEMHNLKDIILEIDTTIEAKRADYNRRKLDIENRRNALASPPRVTDPELQAKINKANELYREGLRRQLNITEIGLEAYRSHISEMRELARHVTIIRAGIQAIEMENSLQMEELEKMQIRSQAAQLRARDAENVMTIQNTLQQEELAYEQQYEQHMEQVQEYEQEQEQEQEQERLVNYELE